MNIKQQQQRRKLQNNKNNNNTNNNNNNNNNNNKWITEKKIRDLRRNLLRVRVQKGTNLQTDGWTPCKDVMTKLKPMLKDTPAI